ncbi:MAG TPA: TonB-dependent receptor [Hyphomonadaceae bacterium]|nr:TonB-dependent receptor [Hyphomonadaceae bacterium]
MAQEPKPDAQAAATSEGVLSYTPADFADSRPNTAMDLINRLPGFSFDGGDQVRGFAGAAGNVLIDGQRPTIKTDSLSDTLNRIPISQVERIDIIRGGAPGIDMQGRTVIANVIRKKGDTFQQIITLNNLVFAETGDTIPGWSYQASRHFGEDQQFDFSVSRGQSYDDSVGKGFRTRRNLSTGDVLLQHDDVEADGLVHTARASYKGPVFGGTFNVNGLISSDEFKDEERYRSATPFTDEFYTSRSANDRAEVGANYKHAIGDKLESESIFLYKWAQGAGDSTGAVAPNQNGGMQPDTSAFRVEATAGETIGRSILRYNFAPTLTFEGGGEIAYNFRNQRVGLTVNNTPVSLHASDVRVEETRGEVFGQATWKPIESISVEGGVRVERSTITESGDDPKERSFNYPKPRILFSWSPTKDDQLRLRVEREVGQLNFQDFASSVSLNSNVVSAGNSDLRPDKRWVYEAAFEKRFWEKGAAVLTLRHEDITDVVDQLPFRVAVDANNDGIPDDANNDGVPDTVLVAGPGNIGDGKNDTLQFSLTVPMANLGIKGGEVKFDGLWQEGEVTDPLTHQKRTITGQRPNNINFGYRQDMPEYNLTWGVNYFAGWSEYRYYLQEVDILRLRNFYGVYLEYKPNPGFTLRFQLDNVDPYKFTIERDVFNDSRDVGSLSEIEIERRHSQVIGQIRARWTIG